MLTDSRKNEYASVKIDRGGTAENPHPQVVTLHGILPGSAGAEFRSQLKMETIPFPCGACVYHALCKRLTVMHLL
ncbi:MAG: hypothetical protein GX125_10310 [Bacteroidales bacterium]|jgi:hypothetical protein|nr:hypothetical protein [Bacteroidota bacterium]NLO00638.1 hypothetical protein [Bacteroidales bacterium]